MKLTMQANFPWEGAVKLTVDEADGSEWVLRVRIPVWCEAATMSVNGEDVTLVVEQGYAVMERAWQPGDVVNLDLPMAPVLMTGHPRVDDIRGSVAIQRGPVVYCLEEVDQEADVDLLDVQIDADGPLVDAWEPDLLGGVVTVEAVGSAVDLEPGPAACTGPTASHATPTAGR